VHEEFNALTQLAPENHLRFHTSPPSRTQQDCRWANDIAYEDSQHREHSLAVVECLESAPGGMAAAGQRASSGSATLL